ncbi:MAG: hypothetical protein HZC41_06560 [Chloroflexi bacterium]|nr:hypothetical protein [Chloroflexota bacterium]
MLFTRQADTGGGVFAATPPPFLCSPLWKGVGMRLVSRWAFALLLLTGGLSLLSVLTSRLAFPQEFITLVSSYGGNNRIIFYDQGQQRYFSRSDNQSFANMEHNLQDNTILFVWSVKNRAWYIYRYHILDDYFHLLKTLLADDKDQTHVTMIGSD